MAFPGSLTPALTASGANFATFQAKGPTGLLEAIIAAQVATADPTVAPTLAASGTGNTLPAATYWVQVTETNGFGETKPIAASASQAVTSGQKLTVTFQTLKSGNAARNVYLSTTSANAGFTLGATGITAGTLDFTAPLPTNSYAVTPPTANSTALTFVDGSSVTINKALELVRGFEKGNGQAAYDYLRKIATNYLQGDGVNFQSEVMKLYHARGAFLLLVQLCNEMGTLMDANAGTLTTAAVGPNRKAVRTFP